ncbi:hypothetical protein DFJ74DRAFT_216309 [Hyaloraphidium curvatum]|nr:hypothetical protein DFJ74DRAFT_216309 [Hyaloraphidium curvatum]
MVVSFCGNTWAQFDSSTPTKKAPGCSRVLSTDQCVLSTGCAGQGSWAASAFPFREPPRGAHGAADGRRHERRRIPAVCDAPRPHGHAEARERKHDRVRRRRPHASRARQMPREAPLAQPVPCGVEVHVPQRVEPALLPHPAQAGLEAREPGLGELPRDAERHRVPEPVRERVGHGVEEEDVHQGPGVERDVGAGEEGQREHVASKEQHRRVHRRDGEDPRGDAEKQQGSVAGGAVGRAPRLHRLRRGPALEDYRPFRPDRAPALVRVASLFLRRGFWNPRPALQGPNGDVNNTSAATSETRTPQVRRRY